VANVKQYAEDLRVIGQALEARDFALYEVVQLSEWYVIHGIPERTDSLRSKVRHWLRRLRHDDPTLPRARRHTKIIKKVNAFSQARLIPQISLVAIRARLSHIDQRFLVIIRVAAEAAGRVRLLFSAKRLYRKISRGIFISWSNLEQR
jgi:hypothetical protein